MYSVYKVCFLVGLMISVLSVVFTGIFDDLDFDIDLDLFGLPIRFTSIIVSVSVFGGVGIITQNLQANIFFAAGSAIIAYVLFTHLFYVVLPRYQTETKATQDAIGQTAQVVVAIKPGKLGRVSYTLDDNILSAVATESIPGNGIKAGAKVLIEDLREDNVFLVSLYKTTKEVKSYDKLN